MAALTRQQDAGAGYEGCRGASHTKTCAPLPKYEALNNVMGADGGSLCTKGSLAQWGRRHKDGDKSHAGARGSTGARDEASLLGEKQEDVLTVGEKGIFILLVLSGEISAFCDRVTTALFLMIPDRPDKLKLTAFLGSSLGSCCFPTHLCSCKNPTFKTV